MRRALLIVLASLPLAGRPATAEPTSRPARTPAAPAFDAAAALAARVREVAADTRVLSVARAVDGSRGIDVGPWSLNYEMMLARLPPARLLWPAPMVARAALATETLDARSHATFGVFVGRMLRGEEPTWLPDVSSAAFPIDVPLIEPLLHDADAHVRTWAIILLARLGRIDVLPMIATMTMDSGVAFPAYEKTQPGSGIGPESDGSSGGPMTPRSVGEIATIVIRRFLDLSSAKGAWPKSGVSLADVARRFVADRDRQTSIAAIRVAVRRLGNQPDLEGARADQLGLSSIIDTIPPPRRFFVLYACSSNFESWPDHAGVEARLERFAAEVPREKRSTLLFPGRSFADPDVEPGFADRYFIEHAERSFVPGDADRFLEFERRMRREFATPEDPNGWSTPEYVIAAARVRPEQSMDVLAEALTNNDGEHEMDTRAAIATEMIALDGSAGFGPAVRWFVDERSGGSSLGRRRLEFLADVRKRRPEVFTAVAALIVRDSRFDRLGVESTRALVELAESRLGRALATDDERRASRSVSEGRRDNAFAPLARWHAILRETVDEWAGPAPATRP